MVVPAWPWLVLVCGWHAVVLRGSLCRVPLHERGPGPTVATFGVVAIGVDAVNGLVGTWARVVQYREH